MARGYRVKVKVFAQRDARPDYYVVLLRIRPARVDIGGPSANFHVRRRGERLPGFTTDDILILWNIIPTLLRLLLRLLRRLGVGAKLFLALFSLLGSTSFILLIRALLIPR